MNGDVIGWHVVTDDFKRPPDHDRRMAQARRRAQWELGDQSWAGVIVAAYFDPDADADALAAEQIAKPA